MNFKLFKRKYSELSKENIHILFLDIYKNIDKYVENLTIDILDDKKFDFLSYPPNSGFTDLEINELKKLNNNDILKSALRKIIADNSAAIVFDILNHIDGTTDPELENENWTGLKIVDLEVSKNNEPLVDFLHDYFFETYWDWMKIRDKKDWKLDML